MKHVTHWIDGKPWDGTGRHRGDIYNPATGQVTGHGGTAPRPADVDAAVAAATAALPGWRDASLTRRAAGAVRVPRAASRQHQDELAALITRRARQGRSDAAGRGRPRPRGRRVRLRHPAPAQGRLLARTSRTGVDAYSIRQPLGVVAGITPFNFPAMVPMWMFPVAIACGNAFILKPSRAGPVGVAAAGRAVAARPACPTACSTWCTATRRRSTRCSTTPTSRGVASSARPRSPATSTRPAAAHGKRVQALGGAKNHMVVLPDADLDLAADAAVSAGLRLGRRALHGDLGACVAVDPIGDELVEQDRRAHRRAEIGPGDRRAGSDMGPLVTAAHRDKVAVLPRRPAPATAPTLVVDGREHPVDRRRPGRLLARARRCSTTSPPSMTRLHRRDLRAGAVRRPRRLLRRGAGR